MKTYATPVEMIQQVEKDLYASPIQYQSQITQDQVVISDPDYRTIELCGYAYRLTAPYEQDALTKMALYTGYIKPLWLASEATERLYSPGNPGVAWAHDKKTWNKHIRNGVFAYTHSERWKEQLPYVINELQRNPMTRQAVMTVYDRHQDMLNWGGYDRVPGDMSMQFMVREGRLICIYNQRSCDFIKSFGADVYLSLQLMKHISIVIDREPGDFIHCIGSLHAFDGDRNKKGDDHE